MLLRFANWITHHTKLVILVALALLVPSFFGFVGTRVNYDILTYLPEDLDSAQGEKILDETFHQAASCMLIVEDMPAKDVDKLKDKIDQIDGVQAFWISDVLGTEIPADILPDVIKNVFFSTTSNSTMMVIQLSSGMADDATMDALDAIKQVTGEQCFLSGMSVLNKDIRDLVEQQVPFYILIAVGLALAAMFLTMKSWVLPFVFLAGIGLAVAYNFGTNVFLGQISYITQAIAAILQLGVTMDYSIFLIDRYDEQKQIYPDKRDAMATAIKATFTSLSGSSLTTIFGFLALCFMELTIGRDIGLVMAKGVMLGVLTVVLVLPALILTFDRMIHRFEHRTFIPNFGRLNQFLAKHHKGVTVVFFLLFIPAVFMKSQAPMYYDMMRSMPEDMPSVIGINKMKDEFNMATTHFVIVDDNLPAKELTAMAEELEKVEGVTAVLSLNTFVGPAIDEEMIPEEIRSICTADGKQMMMVNSEYESTTDEESKQLDQMNSVVKAHDPTGMITGEGALMDDLIQIGDRDIRMTGIISIAAIFIIIAILFRSISVPVITVAAIELAININEGVPYLTGNAVPFIAPIVIGCVQLGATVDYAILLTTRFREERQKGLSRQEAMITAANSADRSVFTSALVLFCATIGVYALCDIEMISSICAMLARGSIISAVVIIFFLGPVLITLEKVIDKTTYHWLSPIRAGDRRRKSEKSPLSALPVGQQSEEGGDQNE